VFRHPAASVLLIVTLLVFALTWPQCLYPATSFAWHNDPQFSIWRLAWIAHALVIDPRHLFDANIFHPALGTLAYSDATFLEGAIGAPLFWIGVRPVLVYNLLLFAGFIGSGMAMFVLVRHLTRSDAAGLVAAAIFALVPYRLEHFGHLELQWAMWIPLAFWAIHRTVEERSWRFGALAGIFLWFQTLSCVYYGVFLAAAMTLMSLLVLAATPRALAASARLIVGAAVAALLAVPYLLPYLAAARQLGPRTPDDLIRYSAKPINYLAAPAANWMSTWTSEGFGASELVLYPGIVAVALALAALLRSGRAVRWVYAAVGVLAVDMSFGARVPWNAWIIAHVPGLDGLRGWGRSAIVAYCALAVLAGFAAARI
jgi:hypothetical protein